MRSTVALFLLLSILLCSSSCNDKAIEQDTRTLDNKTLFSENPPQKIRINLDSLTKRIPGKDGVDAPLIHHSKPGETISFYTSEGVIPGISLLPQSIEEKLKGNEPLKSKKPEVIFLSKSKILQGISPMKEPPVITTLSKPLSLNPDIANPLHEVAIRQNKVAAQHGDSIFPPLSMLALQPKQFPALPLLYKENTLLDISNMGADQGLPNSFIREMTQDKHGNIWIASHTGGIFSYNGHIFKQYTETVGLPTEMTLSLLIDKNDNIWIGTKGGGVTKFDGKELVMYTKKQGLPSNFIDVIFEDFSGNLWFGTRRGLVKFDGESFTKYGDKQGLVQNIVTSICEDQKGNIWIGTNGGVSKFNGNGFQNFTMEDGLPSNYVQSLLVDRNDNLWIGTYGGGVSQFNGKSFTNYSIDQGLGNDGILAMIEDHHHNLWFGTYGDGITRFDGTTFTNFTSASGIVDNYTRSLIEDQAGNLWIGTDGGISRFNPQGFLHVTSDQGLDDDLILTVKQDTKNRFWLAPFNNGLLVSNPGNNDLLTCDYTKISTQQGLIHDIVTSMVEDSEGNYWFGTFDGGLSKLNGKDLSSGELTFTNYGIEQGLPDLTIRALAIDEEGKIFIGSQGGVVIYNNEEGFITLSGRDGLGSDTALCFFQDNIGALWIGTFNGGVSRLYQDTITRYTTGQGLANNTVWCCTQDQNGNHWFGTDGGGISCFDGSGFRNLTTEDGLCNDFVFSIITDNDNSLWAGTVRGLNQIELPRNIASAKNGYRDDSIKVSTYGKMNGLKGLDFFTNAVYLDNKNRLWWGTDKAFTMLNLNEYEQADLAPVIELNGISINDNPFDFGKLKLNKSEYDDLGIKYSNVSPFTNLPENLSLPHKQNHLTFQFSGIEWGAPHQVQHQYILDGFDNQWNSITKDNQADYRNISPGNYIFKVKAIGKSGQWSNTLEYPFSVRSPFYYTWWAIVIYLMAIIGLVWLIIQWRVNTIRKQKKALEGMVRHRTKELKEALKMAEQATIAKSQFIATISHEIRTPLNAIMGMTHLTLNTPLTPKQENFLQKIDKSAATLLGLINDILDFSKIEAGKLQLENVSFDIESVLNLVLILNVQNAHKKNIEFVLQIDPEIPRFLIGDPLRLGQIITNLCNNAIKFTSSGEVVVRLKLGEKINKNEFFLQVEVEDTGIGIVAEQIPTLFDEFKQADNSITRKFGGTGLGLSISKLLAEMMGGRIWVKSKVGAGSSFFFTCKVGIQEQSQQHYPLIPEELKQLNIMVCDSNPSSRTALITILKSFSLSVDAARTGEEVLNILPTKTYDLLLINQELTDMKGLETIMTIRKNSKIRPLKSVLITDTEKSKLSFESTLQGVDAYLSKPYIPSVVLEKILSIYGMENPSSRMRTEHTNRLNEYKQILKDKHFLVAEDNEINSEVVQGLLHNIGVKVDLAIDGGSAFQMIIGQPYDLILMDLHMPIMDGFKATSQLRKHGIDIPIIAITAEAVSHVEQKCEQAGFTAIIGKPIDPELFYDQVLECLNLNPSKVNKQLIPDEFMGVTLPNIAQNELDALMGIRRFGNNPDLYMKMLRKFATSNTTNIEEVKNLLCSSDFTQAYLKMHSFKGESGNLGANRIAEGSLDVEQALKKENLVDATHQLELLEKSVQDFNTKIIPFLETHKYNESNSERSIHQILKELVVYIKSSNPKSLDLLDELSTKDFNRIQLEQLTLAIQKKADEEAISLLEKCLKDL